MNQWTGGLRSPALYPTGDSSLRRAHGHGAGGRTSWPSPEARAGTHAVAMVEVGDISFEDVCAFLEEQGDDDPAFPMLDYMPQPSPALPPLAPPASLGSFAPPPLPPPAPIGPASTHLAGTAGTATSSNPNSMSHICAWPGCGKGFASRWTLERHAKNHQPAVPGGLGVLSRRAPPLTTTCGRARISSKDCDHRV